MRKKLKKITALLLTGALFLTACGVSDKKVADTVGKANDSTKSDGVVKLTVWGEENNEDMLNQMFESFKEKYKNEAKFEITFAENSDAQTRDTILGDIHNAADVFPIPDDQMSALAAAGALDPVPNADEVKKANLEEADDAFTVSDTLYAYPMTADNGYFLYYNKKYLSEDDVKSMDKILAAAKRVHKKMTMEWTSGWYMYAFFGNTGMKFGINDDGMTNYCNWNTKKGSIKGVDVANALIKIAKSGAFSSNADGDFVKNIKTGKFIAGVSGVWNTMEVKEIWGDNYGACKLPTYTVAGKQVQMSSFTGYKAMGVNYYSKNKEWAHKLAEWLTNEDNQTLRFKERNQGPSNIKAAASDEIKQVPAIQAVIDQSQYGTLQRVGNNYWTPFEEFGKVMSSGNSENQDLQKVMDTLVKGITASTVE